MDHSENDVTAINTTATQGRREGAARMAELRRLVEGAEEVTEHDQEGIVSTGGEGRGLLPGRRVGPRRVAVCGRDLAPGLRHRTKNLSWRAAISDELSLLPSQRPERRSRA